MSIDKEQRDEQGRLLPSDWEFDVIAPPIAREVRVGGVRVLRYQVADQMVDCWPGRAPRRLVFETWTRFDDGTRSGVWVVPGATSIPPPIPTCNPPKENP